MRFTFPATVTISGHISIEANSVEEAQGRAEELNDVGVSSNDLIDPEWHSEVYVSEIESSED